MGNTVRVVLPVKLHDSPPPYATGAASDYFGYTRTELQHFDIDLAGRSLKPRSALVAKQPEERDISADLSLLRNDQAHYYQDGVWNFRGRPAAACSWRIPSAARISSDSRPATGRRPSLPGPVAGCR